MFKKNKENKKKRKKKKTRKTTFMRNFGAKTRCIIGNVKVVSLLSELIVNIQLDAYLPWLPFLFLCLFLEA